MSAECPFCDYAGPSEILGELADCILVEPLNPVTPGHRLVIPRAHVISAAENPTIAGKAFYAASHWARPLEGANLITSIGALATQTIKHLHVHIVPRRENDGIMLPWSDEKEPNR